MIGEAWRHTPGGKPRGRGIGLPFAGKPGACNAITDVAGVEIGYETIIAGDGVLVPGNGPVRTGVTAILPRGRQKATIPCAAGCYSLNGNGEMTGTIWIEESGQLETPVTITNTFSCGVARDATLAWLYRNADVPILWGLPVAAETFDGELNDIRGFHVRQEHVLSALDAARGGPVEQGSVGGGTGMICYDFKGGSGTASRLAAIDGTEWTVGVFVQSNFGMRDEFMLFGAPVGRAITNDLLRGRPAGSIIAVVATDAPLAGHQLRKLARRVPLGMARTGAIGHDSSGDIFLAFSTANETALAPREEPLRRLDMLASEALDPLYRAVVEATEEAIVDSMIANETMTGRDGNRSIALPHDRLLEVLREHRVL